MKAVNIMLRFVQAFELDLNAITPQSKNLCTLHIACQLLQTSALESDVLYLHWVYNRQGVNLWRCRLKTASKAVSACMLRKLQSWQYFGAHRSSERMCFDL